jgi:hypothetical protein
MVATSGQIPQRAGSSVVAVQSELIRTLVVEARDVLYASLCLLLLSLPYARARMIQTAWQVGICGSKADCKGSA